MGTSVRWIWSVDKNKTNKAKHGISFETAQLVFDDPLAMSRRDSHPDGDRWQTIGRIGPTIVFVVHTSPEFDDATDEKTGRIMSARKAARNERRAYEEGDF